MRVPRKTILGSVDVKCLHRVTKVTQWSQWYVLTCHDPSEYRERSILVTKTGSFRSSKIRLCINISYLFPYYWEMVVTLISNSKDRFPYLSHHSSRTPAHTRPVWWVLVEFYNWTPYSWSVVPRRVLTAWVS